MSKHETKLVMRDLDLRLQVLERAPAAIDWNSIAHHMNEVSELVSATHNLYRRQAGKDGERALWDRATRLFHGTCTNPPGFPEAAAQLRLGNTGGLESVVQFLEADPWFFRSGYLKDDLLKYVSRVPLDAPYRARLQRVVLNAIDLRDRREFSRYCRLASVVQDEKFRAQVEERLKSDDEGISRRARWALERMAMQRRARS